MNNKELDYSNPVNASKTWTPSEGCRIAKVVEKMKDKTTPVMVWCSCDMCRKVSYI